LGPILGRVRRHHLRVLHINTERTWRGGEQQTLWLARGLQDRGHDSQLCVQPDRELHQRAAAAGLVCHPIAMRTEWDPIAITRLTRLIRARAFDIVHMHTSHAHSLGVIAARLARRARTVVSRRVDFSIYRHALSLSGFKYRHGVDRYIAISQAVKAALVQDGIAADRIDIVHSGVDPDRLRSDAASLERARFGIPESATLVGTVAHMAWHKGLETLIDAAPEIVRLRPDAHVVLVGDGELRAELESRARAGAVASHIHFAGFQKDVAPWHRAFDVFVMPSVMEGLCTSILDAFSLDKPVVASAVGGIPELVHHQRTGLLVPPRDPQALAAAAVGLLNDRQRATQLGTSAHALLLADFTVDSMVEGTLAIYRGL
jgi:glycosyltransferase involved in cell wall biosynthesis